MQSNDRTWDKVVELFSERAEGSGNKDMNEAFLIYHYYSDVEQGGHENFFTHFSEYIDLIGIEPFTKELTSALQKAGAKEYSDVFSRFGPEAYFMFLGLEDVYANDAEAGNALEKADDAYNRLNGGLKGKLEDYFKENYSNIVSE